MLRLPTPNIFVVVIELHDISNKYSVYDMDSYIFFMFYGDSIIRYRVTILLGLTSLVLSASYLIDIDPTTNCIVSISV